MTEPFYGDGWRRVGGREYEHRSSIGVVTAEALLHGMCVTLEGDNLHESAVISWEVVKNLMMCEAKELLEEGRDFDSLILTDRQKRWMEMDKRELVLFCTSLNDQMEKAREERDTLLADYLDLLNGANQQGMDLAHLLDAVEAYQTCPASPNLKAVFDLAAKIQKERS